MARQVPRFVSVLLIALSVGAALWIIGRSVPTESAGAFSAAGMGPSPVTGPAPEIAGKTVQGDTFRLSAHRGKVVLVNFWATWCGPCKMEMPDLVALQNKYGPRGFTIVGVSTDDYSSPASLQPFVQSQGLNYPVLLAEAGLQQKYGGVENIPASFLIDRQGNVVKSVEGATDQAALAPEIEALL